jgi:Icc-related predicted phosphoesterase
VTWCYASDLHGHEGHYRELTGLAASCGALLLGGDLFPRKGHHKGSLDLQLGFVDGAFRSFAEGLAAPGGPRLFVIQGNDDWAGALPRLEALESEGLLTVLRARPSIMSGIRLFGYSFVPPTPFLLKDFEKRDLKDDPPPGGLRTVAVTRDGRVVETDEAGFFGERTSIEEDLAGWTDVAGSVCVMHGPPFGSALDRLYDGRSAGSRAVRQFLLDASPRLSLHGHIHESPSVSGRFAEKIGGTLAVNPGQGGDRLSAVRFDPRDPESTLVHTLLGPFRPAGAGAPA